MFGSSSFPENAHLFVNTQTLSIGASSERQENPEISEEESDQDQSALIRDLVATIEELVNKLSIMKDTEGNASTDNHDKVKAIDVKHIERPDKYDNEVAKFNTWFDKFNDLLTSLGEREIGAVETWLRSMNVEIMLRLRHTVQFACDAEES